MVHLGFRIMLLCYNSFFYIHRILLLNATAIKSMYPYGFWKKDDLHCIIKYRHMYNKISVIPEVCLLSFALCW